MINIPDPQHWFQVYMQAEFLSIVNFCKKIMYVISDDLGHIQVYRYFAQLRIVCQKGQIRSRIRNYYTEV